ncbi:GL21817 [Drosophila persimilis]|uniref:Enhancer of split malpha protein n=2 Tax=pseudoobscura subgroup TaxID=32358 RepID=A0A6I8UQH1_DROPS|nr:enhancer of split malpha protein [Drosophila pseudoobscura]XP_002016905.1 enhancer of split malpha protein [Drosophila persimilis]EDW34005.1 GL21817 [Drosophila persimilis]
MCQQVVVVPAANNSNNKMKTSYSIKQVLKTLFKKQQKQQQQQHPHRHSLESLESNDNLRNAQVEEAYYAEIDENAANEKLAQMAHSQEIEMIEEDQEEDIYVPVRFARTQAGTFFWTTNLQPVASVEPAFCYSMQFQDRWAQA